MPRKAPSGLRDVPYEEEQDARAKWLEDLKRRDWKRVEIEAAEAGWEWAFDTGFDQPELDSDAAGDLADCIMDDLDRRSRGAVADDVYEGISAARRLQRRPAPDCEARDYPDGVRVGVCTCDASVDHTVRP